MLTPLETIFFSHPHRICQKWRHFLPIYERLFRGFRDTPVRFLEIGVSQGGSLDIWVKYFGAQAEIIGVDVDPACLRFRSGQVDVMVGDQGDPAFLQSLAQTIGTVDIVLDDGGHHMHQQIATFEALYPIVREGGVYLCEDTHTSYDPGFGGGVQQPGTMVEWMKGKIDEMHRWYIPGGAPTDFTRTAHALSFFGSMIAVEKQRVEQPLYVEVGFYGRAEQ